MWAALRIPARRSRLAISFVEGLRGRDLNYAKTVTLAAHAL
ncbi:hypothetical protein NJ7G_3240 [Natrinema sp. J7-2]|nr:hypothetical protein NJ7G_3240 [Natrinema sp. J7-2]